MISVDIKRTFGDIVEEVQKGRVRTNGRGYKNISMPQHFLPWTIYLVLRTIKLASLWAYQANEIQDDGSKMYQ